MILAFLMGHPGTLRAGTKMLPKGDVRNTPPTAAGGNVRFASALRMAARV